MADKLIRTFFRALSLTPLLIAGCGGSSEKALGEECDPEIEVPCAEGLVCSESGDTFACTHEAGDTCELDSDVENQGCPEMTECILDSELGSGADEEPTPGRCLLVRGADCSEHADLCSPDLVCADTEAGERRCFEPVVFRGGVSDASDASPVAGAHVMALNDEGYAVTDVAVTDADGSYELEVPVARTDDGAPVDAEFTLRSEADAYQAFPSGIRVALPVSAGNAELETATNSYVVSSALTDISLIPLDEATLFSVSGQLLGASESTLLGGVLIVLTGSNGTFTTLTDLGGAFTAFNVPDGEYTVEAYADDLQVERGSVSVSGGNVEAVQLRESEASLASVSGNIQIVNAPGGAVTSVILVVSSTFDENAARGIVPRGLRAPRSGPVSVSGDFTIEGVPVGRYTVLAAYENDFLVRDPDTNIAGTGFVEVEVTAADAEISIADSFKVTEALAIVGPGVDGPEEVNEAPSLEWADDSSEDWYDVRVFDAFGTEVWNELGYVPESGGATISLPYGGPLDAGMYYQFRVTSWRQPGNGDAAPISATEDLRGVFFSSN